MYYISNTIWVLSFNKKVSHNTFSLNLIEKSAISRLGSRLEFDDGTTVK